MNLCMLYTLLFINVLYNLYMKEDREYIINKMFIKYLYQYLKN